MSFREKVTHDLLDETIIIIFAELARFGKPLEDCSSDLDRMLYVLKNSGNLKNRSGWLRSRIYAKILEASEIARFSEEKRIQYNKDMIDERRREGELQAAKRIGWEEGREEGSRQARMELAKKLLAKGMTFNEVSEVTSLSEEELAEF